jgi:crotonobetainyl-CoA:carnitine CoA-transferase CaiB-like acyl-CoA transferase
MLSDLGAEVVKVEPPEGDITRIWGKKIQSLSGYFTQQNAGKQNISIDLRKEAGVDLLKQLAGKADILLENFRPGIMERFGLDWDTLSESNPRLIMASISGFGQSGPESQRAAYAPIIHGEVGVTNRQALKGNNKATDFCMSFADTIAGLHSLVGLLSVLHMRERTGKGQHIDIAMVDAMLATDDYAHYILDEHEPDNGKSEVFDATGGSIVMAADFRHVWKQLVKVHNFTDPTPAGAPLAEKIRLRRNKVADYLCSFATREELINALDDANLAWGELYSSNEFIRSSPTVKHRNSIVQVDDRAGGLRSIPQSPYRFSDAKSGVRGEASFQGEQTDKILSEWLDFSDPDIQSLKDRQIVLQESADS